MNAQLTYPNHSRSSLNSASYSLNPSTSGDLDLVVTQNLLQGFGRAVNGRNIRVQKNNVKVSALQFKQQVITTVSAALNLYWDLVSFDADVRARQREVDTAQQLLEDNKKLVQYRHRGAHRNHPRGIAVVRRPAGSGDRADQPAAAGNHSEELPQP